MVKERIQFFLNQPYPFNGNPRQYWKVIVGFGGFVSIFLFVFKPFGLHVLPAEEQLYVALSFGVVTMLSLFLVLVFTVCFPSVFNDDRWTIGKEIALSAFTFFAVSNANYLFVRFGWYKQYMMLDYWSMVFATITIGFFPFLMLLLLGFLKKLKQNLKQAEELTMALSHEIKKVSDHQISFIGENETDHLEVYPQDVLYISSSGNYIEVVYLKDQKPDRSILRSTLTKAEEVVSHLGGFFRCHRTFLVNLNRVGEVHGNAQGYRLDLGFDLESIPVARAKNQFLKEHLRSLA